MIGLLVTLALFGDGLTGYMLLTQCSLATALVMAIKLIVSDACTSLSSLHRLPLTRSLHIGGRPSGSWWPASLGSTSLWCCLHFPRFAL